MDNLISLILKMELAFLSRRHLKTTRGVIYCGISLYKVDLKYIIFKPNQKLEPAPGKCLFFCAYHANSLLMSVYTDTLH